MHLKQQYEFFPNLFSTAYRFASSSLPTNHYDMLKVQQSATPIEIKNAYIECCKECHPDVSDDPQAVDQFRKVQEAYRVLSNSDNRLSYDFEIGNINRGRVIDPCDSGDMSPRSAKRGRAPMNSPAERAVMQR